MESQDEIFSLILISILITKKFAVSNWIRAPEVKVMRTRLVMAILKGEIRMEYEVIKDIPHHKEMHYEITKEL